MRINTETLRDECKARRWKFTCEAPDGRFMITTEKSNVTVVSPFGCEARVYANGLFREVGPMMNVVDACDEEERR